MRKLIIILLSLLLSACQAPPDTALERIKAAGELVVGTRNSATTYYEGPEGPTGLEYRLAKRFADRLGVKLRLVVPERFTDLLDQLEEGEIDLIAAGLTVTERRKRRFLFGPSYQKIRQQVVYNKYDKRPRKVADLEGHTIEIIDGTSHEEQLRHLRQNGYPQIGIGLHAEADAEELLALVNEGLISYTIADSNEIALNRRFYTNLRVGFHLTPPEPLAWAFTKSDDTSLIEQAELFFKDEKASGALEHLLDQFYGHVDEASPAATQTFLRHIAQRLPPYREAFIKAGEETGLDWRLLAAVAYQESRWNKDAVSPTGVRGLMMLTLNTAKLMGIADREDPLQSIDGGARYLKRVIGKIPERIEEPDRTWFGLASYNVGFGHLEDARVLASKAKANADRWHIVKHYLPLLSQRKWYSQTRHGYARGEEPVVYVQRIRRYYDLLVWYETEEAKSFRESMPKIPEINVPTL